MGRRGWEELQNTAVGAQSHLVQSLCVLHTRCHPERTDAWEMTASEPSQSPRCDPGEMHTRAGGMHTQAVEVHTQLQRTSWDSKRAAVFWGRPHVATPTSPPLYGLCPQHGTWCRAERG